MLSVAVAVALIYLAATPHCVAKEGIVRVYCAAGLKFPLESLIERFNRQFGAHVEIVRSGGSGELAGQIKTESRANVARGADLYISADKGLLIELANQGIITKHIALANQKPVIAVAVNSQLEFRSLADLINAPDIRFGVASEQAAIGKVTRAIARRDGVLELLEQEKSTDSENVMVLGQALVTGSLDAAIIWDTTVSQINQQNGPQLKIATLADPTDAYLGEVVVGVIGSTNSLSECLNFCQYLAAPETSQSTFEQFGFSFRSGADSTH